MTSIIAIVFRNPETFSSGKNIFYNNSSPSKPPGNYFSAFIMSLLYLSWCLNWRWRNRSVHCSKNFGVFRSVVKARLQGIYGSSSVINGSFNGFFLSKCKVISTVSLWETCDSCRRCVQAAINSRIVGYKWIWLVRFVLHFSKLWASSFHSLGTFSSYTHTFQNYHQRLCLPLPKNFSDCKRP